MYVKKLRVGNNVYEQVAMRINNPNESRIMTQICGPSVGLNISEIECPPRVVPGFANTTNTMKIGVITGQLIACLDKSLELVDAQLAILIKVWEFSRSYHDDRDIRRAVLAIHRRYPHLHINKIFSNRSITALNRYYSEVRSPNFVQDWDVSPYIPFHYDVDDTSNDGSSRST